MGNSRSGRPRKPAAKLKLHGTFRADRHADRGQGPQVGGSPEKPTGLDDAAGWLWDFVTAGLADRGILAHLDTPHLWAMCECWSLYRKAVKEALVDPLDKPTRAAVTAYKSAFDASAARVGLNPADREKLHGPKQDKPRVRSRVRA